jgi:hypothetical protein
MTYGQPDSWRRFPTPTRALPNWALPVGPTFDHLVPAGSVGSALLSPKRSPRTVE